MSDSAGCSGMGTRYVVLFAFGHFPIAPFLEVLDQRLEPGSTIEMITLIPKVLRRHAKERGLLDDREVWGSRKVKRLRTGPGGELASLIEVARDAKLEEAAVWFTAFSPSGTVLLEAEDGNATIWLSDDLPSEVHQELLRCAGNAHDRYPDVPPTPR